MTTDANVVACTPQNTVAVNLLCVHLDRMTRRPWSLQRPSKPPRKTWKTQRTWSLQEPSKPQGKRQKKKGTRKTGRVDRVSSQSHFMLDSTKES